MESGAEEEKGGSDSGSSLGCRKKTVFIFDWDDTLMATTQLERRRMKCKKGSFVSGYVKNQLERLDQMVCKSLETTALYGEVVIITNAPMSWVWLSCSAYLPNTRALIDYAEIPVISARDRHAASIPCMPTKWKAFTFVEEMLRMYSSTEQLNLVVIGDSLIDLIAAHEAFDGWTESVLKMVKFVESPTVAELMLQMRVLFENLEMIVDLPTSVNLSVYSGRRSECSA